MTTILTPTEGRYLLAWHISHDVPKVRVPNQGRIYDSLIRKGMLWESGGQLLVTAEGRLWCDDNHLEVR